MGAQKQDLDTVANGLWDLLQDLEKRSTFPGEDPGESRFLEVVRVCEQMLWGVRDWVPFRKRVGQEWGPAARLMQEQMQPLLHEACALECSQHVWFLKPIHEIRRLVDGICEWQEEAAAAQAAKDAAQAAKDAARGTVLEQLLKAAQADKAALAAVTSRHLEAFETVTVVKTTPPAVMLLTAERREALRQVVKEMREHIFTLKEDVKDYSSDRLALIEQADRYVESCKGEDTWIWDAEAWGAASGDLTRCRDHWRKFAQKDAAYTNYKRLWGECEACMQDIAAYKRICDNGEEQATSWRARASRLFGLTAKLEALKLCV
jgi:hypothetical protein